MDKRDARSLTPETQEEIRRQAIRLLKSLKPRELAEQLEVSRNAVYEWIKAHKAGGMKALKAKRQGRPKGSGLTLSEEQQSKIRIIICDATPDQLKMPFALWTREAIALLIKDLFQINLERRQVGRYLKRWPFTPQHPVKRAYERNDKAVRKWMDKEYPAITKKAALHQIPFKADQIIAEENPSDRGQSEDSSCEAREGLGGTAPGENQAALPAKLQPRSQSGRITELAKRPERRLKGKFKEAVRSTIKKLQSLPKRVARYFNAKPLSYIQSSIKCAG